ncbi:hypothetical protein OIU84_022752 [Salix udensis]|uniref:Uncharacterized protein n=1 Tax=Salix udensis TaxID=889485 RepID=A0AAD6KPM9_9ROSI|nr:hypothetical protein OIU84_022752 [Salix udensis]
MVGLLKGFWLTHMQATSSTCSISSSKPFPLRRRSKTSSCLPSLLICCTQPTNSLDIFGLHTSIHNMRLTYLVHVSQTTTCSPCNLKSSGPI